MEEGKFVPSSDQLIRFASPPDSLDPPTEWRAIIIIAAISFLSIIEGSLIHSGEYPYMIKLDPEATTQYFGLATSISKLGHAVFVLLFAIWSHKWHVSRLPLFVGRVVALLGCLLYLSVEFFPSNRRYILTACYTLFGISSSAAPIIRTYIVLKSSSVDRARAFALLHVSMGAAIIFGPVFQLIFSGIEYPGYTIFAKAHFHIYSAPIWVALFLNVVSMVVIACCFIEPEYEPESKEVSDTPSISIEAIKEKIREIRNLPYNWALVAGLFMQKICTHIAMASNQSTGSPIMMSVFGLTGSETVRVGSVTHILFGVLALSSSAAFLFTRLGKSVPARLLYAIGLSVMAAKYIGIYPFPWWSHPLTPFNATTGAGCKAAEFSWCDSALTTSLWVYLPISIAFIGLTAPITSICFDAFYSKSIMQSFLLLGEDAIMVAGPLYATAVFTGGGASLLWLINCAVLIVALIIWVIMWPKLGRYK